MKLAPRIRELIDAYRECFIIPPLCEASEIEELAIDETSHRENPIRRAQAASVQHQVALLCGLESRSLLRRPGPK